MSSTNPVGATAHGFSRFGRHRQLKRALEQYWAGKLPAAELLQVAAELRAENLSRYAQAGMGEVPVGDFSLYDHVLDTAFLVGAVPSEYRTGGSELDNYFAAARGTDALPAWEMTKWFDTNYHYLVPRIGPDAVFELHADRLLAQIEEAKGQGLTPRPVVVGPVTFLALARPAADAPAGFEPLDRLGDLLGVYGELLAQVHAAGVAWVQLDEPILSTDLDARRLEAVEQALQQLTAVETRPKILVAHYFGRLDQAAELLATSPVEGVAVDLVAGGEANLNALAHPGFAGKRVIAGIVDGRNIWATDLTAALAKLHRLRPHVGTLDVAPSCSLLHVPVGLADEGELAPEVLSWLAFGEEKLAEVATLATAINDGVEAAGAGLAKSDAAARSRRESTLIHNPAVAQRVASTTEDDARRNGDYEVRVAAQAGKIHLPLLPTTTIGSFPQTAELRAARAQLRKGGLSPEQYEQRMRQEIDAVIDLQEQLGLDVLVHGEPERNDMVQYFAEHLEGFVTTSNGWVQSYGSRQVRPPILFGDVSRPEPITVPWTSYAAGRTEHPVKGMLTGPVTILAWSFVRDDQHLGDTATQVAWALRDEVRDLEAAGTPIIQVDEPALRETLPLRLADQQDYLRWSTRAFRIATSGVADQTQIHTHMCYADFGDIFAAIEELDADVISLEAARSGDQLADDLKRFGYRKGIGPGVYDIHSPRVPGPEEMEQVLVSALAAVPVERLWVNPDCGLKTRTTEQVRAALSNLVEVAVGLRARIERGEQEAVRLG